MSPGSNTASYPAFAHIGLRENPGKNLNQQIVKEAMNTILYLGETGRTIKVISGKVKCSSKNVLKISGQGKENKGKARRTETRKGEQGTDRLDTATCTHTLLSSDVHIRTDHVRYTLRYLHCFSVVSCPHPSDSALNGILYDDDDDDDSGGDDDEVYRNPRGRTFFIR
ncbi:hypothetical protein ANN_26622 [Periplaneta americana]|uniref:Uncharacterized protein n=1 Tax=Periplaneta americana TaxID=6978 RepID=A0ABQ8RYK4_PERAM|nr:hypothetical protein ANN_26622 [Periplaneta americana]